MYAALIGGFAGALIVMFLLASLFGLMFRGMEPSERAMRAAFITSAFALTVSWFSARSFTEWLARGVLYIVAASLVFLVKRWQYKRARPVEDDELEQTFH